MSSVVEGSTLLASTVSFNGFENPSIQLVVHKIEW